MRSIAFLILISLTIATTQAGRLRRQVVTGDSVVATPGGGLASVPAFSQVVPPGAPVAGIQTDPFRPSVVSIAGIPGATTNIQPGSKIVPSG